MKRYSDFAPLVLTAIVLAVMCRLAHTASQQQGVNTEPPIDLTKFNSPQATCPVHHVRLKKDVVPIRYGCSRLDPILDSMTYNKSFPHVRRQVNVGSFIPSPRPEMARVKFCPKCREAETLWTKKRRAQSNQR